MKGIQRQGSFILGVRRHAKSSEVARERTPEDIISDVGKPKGSVSTEKEPQMNNSGFLDQDGTDKTQPGKEISRS